MASPSTRRSPSRGRAAGAGLLAPERPQHSVIEHLERVLPQLSEPDPEPAVVEEEEVYEEVTVEPDLPMEPVEPVDQARAHYDAMVAAMSPDEPVYVAGRRAPRLKLGEYTLKPGDVVPGAYYWSRREAYERLGRIERR